MWQQFIVPSIGHSKKKVLQYWSQKDERDEGAHTAVEDCRADVDQGRPNSVFPTSGSFDKKSVRDVSRVVDAEADGNDQVDAGDRIDRQAPEVDESGDVNQRQHDHGQDEQ